MMKTDKTAARKKIRAVFCKINGTQLKILAAVLMCIDHVGAVFFPWDFCVSFGMVRYPLLRVIGRLSFPIFAFLLTEGAVHTSNGFRYAIRLLVLFFVSEIPYDLLFHGSLLYLKNQNIMLTLLLGLLVVETDLWANRRVPGAPGATVGLLALLAGCAAAEWLHADYGLHGILMIYLLYQSRNNSWKQLVSLVLVNVLFYGGMQSFAAAAWIPIALYDGTRGNQNRLVRDGFYVFYPLHLLVLLFLSSC